MRIVYLITGFVLSIFFCADASAANTKEECEADGGVWIENDLGTRCQKKLGVSGKNTEIDDVSKPPLAEDVSESKSNHNTTRVWNSRPTGSGGHQEDSNKDADVHGLTNPVDSQNNGESEAKACLTCPPETVIKAGTSVPRPVGAPPQSEPAQDEIGVADEGAETSYRKYENQSD